MEEKIEALETAFAEFQKFHKRSLWEMRLFVGLASIACTCCFAAGVIHVLKGRWVYLGLMVVLFWWDFILMVKQIVMLENEKADFRRTRIQHQLVVEHLKKGCSEDEGNN